MPHKVRLGPNRGMVFIHEIGLDLVNPYKPSGLVPDGISGIALKKVLTLIKSGDLIDVDGTLVDLGKKNKSADSKGKKEPVVTKEPVVVEEAVVTEESMITEEPVVTEEPAEEKAPKKSTSRTRGKAKQK